MKLGFKVRYEPARRIFSTRSAARVKLKLFDLPPDKCDDFIEVLGDGRYRCRVLDAVRSLRQPTTLSMTRTCDEMIYEGFSNAEIFKVVYRDFSDLNRLARHRLWPSWRRCQLRRQGRLPPAFDKRRQDPRANHRFEK
jgi:hypothetical protein